MLPFFESEISSIRCFITHQFQFPQHLHQSIEIIFCKKGSVSLYIEASVYTLMPGDVAYVFPNTIHSYLENSNAGEQDIDCLILIAAPKYWSCFTKILTQNQPVLPILYADKIHPDIYYALEGLYHETHEAPDRDYVDFVCRGFMELLLARSIPALSLSPAKSPGQQDLTRQIMLYVQEHFQEPLSLDILSAHLNISKYYLSHIFSDKLKMSFPTYVNEFRLNHALEKIHGGAVNITEIWQDSGFESQRTFNRVFLFRTGKTPRDYIQHKKCSVPTLNMS